VTPDRPPAAHSFRWFASRQAEWSRAAFAG
jgi:hypothetical protein